MNIDRHYYAPTPEQKAQLKIEAARLRGRTRAMRALRDTVSGFSRLTVATVRGSDAVAKLADQYRELGWPDSHVAELAPLHAELHFPEGGKL